MTLREEILAEVKACAFEHGPLTPDEATDAILALLTSPEAVERVARWMCKDVNGYDDEWKDYAHHARAALAALIGEPTDDR